MNETTQITPVQTAPLIDVDADEIDQNSIVDLYEQELADSGLLTYAD